MKIFSINGVLTGFLSERDETTGLLVPDSADIQEIDEETNADVIQALREDWDSHSWHNGRLHRDGSPVVVAPDSVQEAERKGRRLLVQKLRQGNATSLELQRVVAFLLKKQLGD